jgi:ribosomal subunit interface protein
MRSETMTKFPVEIAFRNVDRSDAVEANIREKIARLEQFFDRIHYIRVTVEAVHRRGHKGRLYGVNVTVGVPGKDVVVSRTGPLDHAHEDVYVAVRDAFQATTRRLEDHVRKGRHDVKTHAAPLHGKVARLFPYEGYGFVAAPDGLEVYFHKNSVVEGTFDGLEVGAEVRFVLAENESLKGPQASTVKPVGKHHVVP